MKIDTTNDVTSLKTAFHPIVFAYFLLNNTESYPKGRILYRN